MRKSKDEIDEVKQKLSPITRQQFFTRCGFTEEQVSSNATLGFLLLSQLLFQLYLIEGATKLTLTCCDALRITYGMLTAKYKRIKPVDQREPEYIEYLKNEALEFQFPENVTEADRLKILIVFEYLSEVQLDNYSFYVPEL